MNIQLSGAQPERQSEVIAAGLRPALEQDAGALAALYRSTRKDLLALPMPAAFIDQFIQQQQQFQAVGIQQQHPQAQTQVLELQGQVVARIIFDHSGDDLRLIDIAVLPGAQRQGLGRALLMHLQQMAAAHHASLSLRVFKDNGKARTLYLSAGFHILSEDAMSEQMQWRAGGAA
jgi:ribosomal protein S18 acetylase RimI-like enzyme